MTDIDDTLNERGKRYGEFKDLAAISQALKDVMRSTLGWQRLKPSQRESLEMNVHKIARILNGDSNYVDSWHDIAGYARLVEDELTNDGWLEWKGGDCPVADDVWVHIKHRNGDIRTVIASSAYHWYHGGDGSDIIAYKVAK